MRASPAFVFALLLPLAGCVQLNWSRLNLEEPVGDERVVGLHPGESNLGDCLNALGAPHQVWENNGGMVLAWTWYDEGGWSASVSYSFTRFVSASFNYGDSDADIKGLVLVLDGDLRLKSIRRGYFADITTDLPRRPTAVIDDD